MELITNKYLRAKYADLMLEKRESPENGFNLPGVVQALSKKNNSKNTSCKSKLTQLTANKFSVFTSTATTYINENVQC